MKHHKRLFGKSLEKGLRNVGYSDVLMELIGILMHWLSMSPYASHIKDIMSELAPMVNSSEIDWINNILDDGSSGNITCGYHNGSHSAFNTCVAEITFGSAGIIIHVIQLGLVLVLLKCGRERQANKCHLWVRITTVLTVLESLIVVGSLCVKYQDKLLAHLIAHVVYKCYGCSLVSAYVSQAKEYSDIPGIQSPDPPLIQTQPSIQNSGPAPGNSRN